MSSRARVILPVRWSDVDLFGHVNNAAFLRFLDDARFTAFPGMGVDADGQISSSVLVVVKNEIDYVAPVRFTSDPLAVEVWVSRIGTSSVDFGYEMGVLQDGEDQWRSPALRARSRMVQVERDSGAPRPFSEDERAALSTHVDDEPALRGW